VAEMEREYIIRVLRNTGGVISAAAIRLGVPRTTLNAMMRKLGISRKRIFMMWIRKCNAPARGFS